MPLTKSFNKLGGSEVMKNFSKPKDMKNTFNMLLKYLGTEKKLMFSFIIFLIINSLASFAPSMITAPLIDELVAVKNFKNLAINTLIKYIIILAVIALIGVISNYAYNFLALKLSQKTVNRIRKDLFARMKYLPIRYFDSIAHGEIMSRFTNDMDNISDALNNSLPQLISSFITLIGTLAVMIYLSPILVLVTCLMLPLMLKSSSMILNMSRQSFRNQQKNLGILNGFIEETMEGQKVVKAFCYEKNIKAKFDECNENYRSAAAKSQIYSGIIMPIMFNINNINYALSTAIGAVLILLNQLTIGRLTSFLQLARQFARPVADLSSQFTTVQSALAGAERIFEIMNEQQENQNIESQVELDKNILHDVKFSNVTFGYLPEKIVLKNISFTAKPGEKIALVGSTGAGKTTIANLITRFYDTIDGSIEIDGINIKKFSLKNLRALIGTVLQDTHLFDGTIIENIRYGRLDATDEECIEAAKLSNADSFIKRLPHGYNTVIHEDGNNLSQGQRQLLNIARVAVSSPAILIFDEATSSVDTRTEELIENGMNKLMSKCTTFVIAHRLSTIKNANTILVIENGEIIEHGSHNDLINERGRYYQLCSGQYELK